MGGWSLVKCLTRVPETYDLILSAFTDTQERAKTKEEQQTVHKHEGEKG